MRLSLSLGCFQVRRSDVCPSFSLIILLLRSRAWMASRTVSRMVAASYSLRGGPRRACRVVGTTRLKLQPTEPEYVYHPVRRVTSAVSVFHSQRYRTIVLVLAPTPLVAALFIGFGRVVDRLGTQYSRLKPTFCTSVCRQYPEHVDTDGCTRLESPRL